jgi:3-deoxy-D-manno-octulosonic-acid transferase
MEGVRALLDPLRRRLPDHAVVVSALTRTGRAAAERMDVDAAVFFPLDAPRPVEAALDSVRPRLFAFTETELWPVFLSGCAARNIPCLMLSGRISVRSARRYTWLRPLMQSALSGARFCVQSGDDAGRLEAMGVDGARIDVAGNLKAEAPLDQATARIVADVWRRAGIEERVLIVGASTHRGEEAALLEAFERLESARPELRLLLAPRHPERFGEVGALLDARTRWVRFSELEVGRNTAAGTRVVLLDRMGILRACFPFARVVFVGGTLAPVGGHNLLEPAAEGCPVVFGPHTDHVAAMARALLETGGGRRVADTPALSEAIEGLWGEYEAAGRRAAAAALSQRGAVTRHLAVIEELLRR